MGARGDERGRPAAHRRDPRLLKAGQTVKARCHPLRDNSRGCLLGFLKAPDGTIKDGTATIYRSLLISEKGRNQETGIGNQGRAKKEDPVAEAWGFGSSDLAQP